jgi:hypothetical protein
MRCSTRGEPIRKYRRVVPRAGKREGEAKKAKDEWLCHALLKLREEMEAGHREMMKAVESLSETVAELAEEVRERDVDREAERLEAEEEVRDLVREERDAR